MRRPSDALPVIYLCANPVDFRRGINGLSMLVDDILSLDPFSGYLFVFSNRLSNKVKLLYWEKNGFCLWQKSLEKDRFHWPRHLSKGARIELSGRQLNWLLDGVDLRHVKEHKPVNYSEIY
ncbi:IS66 family insertion sequence element accessory protein TnpB [Kiloniella sp.]|uniref:IS66 family insertion sequence element accessory protein TnpB n=1 Tax=Kiloniella sp. TaxID=1938587 RepID=UPI003B018CDD